MDLDVDPARILLVVGVLFGIAAVLYFARDIVFELSITVRAILLLLTFAGLLLAALATSRRPFVSVFAVLSAAAYIAFFAYTLARFNVGSDGTFFGLMVSAALFLLLGYVVQEREISPSRRTVRYLIVGIVVIATAAVGADMVASDVEYDVRVADEADVENGGELVVGTLTIENQFLFREPIDVPRAFACVYVPAIEAYDMRPDPVRYRLGEDRVPDSVPGGRTMLASMTIGLSDEEAAAISGPVPIERATECPAESQDPRIVLVMGNEMPRPPRPG